MSNNADIDKAERKRDITLPDEQTGDSDDKILRAKAEVYYNEGNEEYKKENFSNAVHFYTDALNINYKDEELRAKLYSSRADAHFSLENYSDSLKDARLAIELQPRFVKAILSGANACVKLNLFEDAVMWCDKGLAVEKENQMLLELKNMFLKTKSIQAEQSESGLETDPVDNKLIREQQGKTAAQNRTGQEWAYHSGMRFLMLGDFKAALKSFEEFLSSDKDAGDKERQACAYRNLAICYNHLGNPKKAIEFCQHVLSIAKEVENKDLEGMAYTNLGSAHSSLGDFSKAIEYHQHSLVIAKQVENKTLEGQVCINLGNAYFFLGDYKAAIDSHKKGLSITRQVGDKESEGNAYLSLGNAYDGVGDFETAIKYHKQALSFIQTVGNKVAEGKVYLNLGNAYFSLDNFEDAIENYEEALCIAKQVGDKDTEAIIYNSLGGAYNSLGDPKKAIEYIKQNLKIAKEVGNRDLEGIAYGNLGLAYHSLDDPKTAIDFYQQALGIAKEVGNKEFQAKACANLGAACCALDDFSGAEDFYKSSVRLFDETRALLKSNDEWKISLRNQYDREYKLLWLLQLEQNKHEEALSTAERGRAQALMDIMEADYGVKSRVKSAQPYSDQHTINVSNYLATSMTVFLAESPNSVNFWVLQGRQPTQFAQKEISDDLESLTHKAYKHIGVFKKVMCENRSLDEPADEESEEVSKRNSDERELTSEEEEEGDPLKVLSDVLIRPISHLMQGDEVIIVPDAALFLVPYAALVDQHSRYLSETLRIRLVPTLTSLKLMTECPEGYHSTSGALLVGDPLVKDVRINGKRVTQLPGAKQEVEMIGTILSITPLTGENATKAEVLNKLNSVALVHIAAHGKAKTGEIILCPNPDGPNKRDFLLTMADVLNVKLRAKLVVLSCCHSGRGKIKAEGVVGLARAFLGAGARSVLASLWAIDDKATLEFMRYFYEHLVKGQSASKALNQAMKRMRESDDFSDVKYWAPFLLIGDDVSLEFGELRVSLEGKVVLSV